MSEIKEGDIDYFEEMKNSSVSRKMKRLDAYNLGSNMDILEIIGNLSYKYTNNTDLRLIYSDRIAPLKRYITEIYKVCDEVDKEILKESVKVLSRPKGIFPFAFGYELQRIFEKNEQQAPEVETSEFAALEQ